MGPVTITNSMLGSLLAFLVLLLLIAVATRRLERRPGKLQAAVELVVGGMYNFAKASGGSVGARVFPLFAGLLIWLLINNWLALIPGFGQITVCCDAEGQAFPLFRAMNADYNSTLALA
jgi:F-type H+-transporting ATPase subunit a